MYQMIWTINIGLFFFVPSVTGKVMYTHVHDVVQGIFLAIEADKKKLIMKHLSFVRIILLMRTQ